MAIFRREEESESPAGRSTRETSPSATATHVAPGSSIVGRIEGATDVVIDGHLDGEVVIDGRVRVGAGGRVEGRLEAALVEVGGEVDGDIQGHERIILTTSARLHGDLEAPRVVIEEGAFFKGRVNMSGHRQGVRSTPAASSKPASTSQARSPEARTEGGSP